MKSCWEDLLLVPGFGAPSLRVSVVAAGEGDPQHRGRGPNPERPGQCSYFSFKHRLNAGTLRTLPSGLISEPVKPAPLEPTVLHRALRLLQAGGNCGLRAAGGRSPRAPALRPGRGPRLLARPGTAPAPPHLAEDFPATS